MFAAIQKKIGGQPPPPPQRASCLIVVDYLKGIHSINHYTIEHNTSIDQTETTVCLIHRKYFNHVLFNIN